ncbi:MAG: hypothetical protein K2X31_09100, partial [Sphingopyxis sp.]|nr:hypothetical protein [Sphingopyxis sp.]
MDDETPQSRGGKARAQSLTPEARKEIATRAAQARWGTHGDGEDSLVPKAIAMGVLRIGNIPCAVLDDSENTRVLTHSGLLAAIGRTGKPKSGSSTDAEREDLFSQLPAFLRAKNLEPFISKDLIRSSTPILFETGGRGGLAGRAYGFRAQVLTDVCWVYAKAQMARKLTKG